MRDLDIAAYQARSREELQSGRFRARPIGENDTRKNETLTSLQKVDGVWFYAEEIPFLIGDAPHRAFLRREPASGRLRQVAFRRQELSVEAAVADSHGLRAGFTLLVVDKPLACFGFRFPPLQARAGTGRLPVFEDLDHAGLPATPEARARMDDLAAIRALHGLDADFFLTGRGLGVSLGALEPGRLANPDVPFDPFADDDVEISPDADEPSGPARPPISGYALGVVADVKVLRDDLYRELLPVVQALRAGTYRVPPARDLAAGGLPDGDLPAGIAALGEHYLDLSIYQAMAGAGREAHRQFDRPVSTYALEVFHQHLRAAMQRLRLAPKGSGRAPR